MAAGGEDLTVIFTLSFIHPIKPDWCSVAVEYLNIFTLLIIALLQYSVFPEHHSITSSISRFAGVARSTSQSGA